MKNLINLLFVFAVIAGVSTAFGMKRGSTAKGKTHKKVIVTLNVDTTMCCQDVAKLLSSCEGVTVVSLEDAPNSPGTESPSPEAGNPEKESKTERGAEFTAKERFCYRKAFSQLAWKMGTALASADHSALISLAHELMESYACYKEKGVNVAKFVKEESDFKFCCGIVAFYLSEEKVGKVFADWFKEIFSMGMSKKMDLT